jgi:hypothetical protein
MNLEEVLQALYDSEINAEISWLWDGGEQAAPHQEFSIPGINLQRNNGGGWYSPALGRHSQAARP